MANGMRDDVTLLLRDVNEHLECGHAEHHLMLEEVQARLTAIVERADFADRLADQTARAQDAARAAQRSAAPLTR